MSGGTGRPMTRLNKKATTPQLGRKAATALRPKSAGSPILQKRALPMPATASGKNLTSIVTLNIQITASNLGGCKRWSISLGDQLVKTSLFSWRATLIWLDGKSIAPHLGRYNSLVSLPATWFVSDPWRALKADLTQTLLQGSLNFASSDPSGITVRCRSALLKATVSC